MIDLFDLDLYKRDNKSLLQKHYLLRRKIVLKIRHRKHFFK